MPCNRVASDAPVVLGDASRPRATIARPRAVSSPPRACRRCSCPCAAARSRAAPCHVARVGWTGARAAVRAAVTLRAQSAVQRPCALSGATRHAQARRLRTRKTCVHVPCVRQLRTASRAAGVNANPSRKALAPALSAETPAAQWRVDDTRRRSDRRALAPLWDRGAPDGLPRDNGWARRLVGKGTSVPTGNANAAAESSLGNCDRRERTGVGPHGSQRSRADSFSSVQGSKRQREATAASHEHAQIQRNRPHATAQSRSGRDAAGGDDAGASDGKGRGGLPGDAA
ncbi:hypothetical protein, conserved in T. vivax [Trypanosoma vivax Y486]|uniref:Uncharacterized protein n=1 Tax=Trypanosoma vivax (strain Y486) TaxID=1055687 RepID=F9WSK2_TRYVY|nr:hypothetical protein, conserved in T. vivax [Trypanosoma vivax Y486]|eukprot:CCD20541.1 hypothetical protein, conserved in T. vivax [Trypanosoma vivax Y486]